MHNALRVDNTGLIGMLGCCPLHGKQPFGVAAQRLRAYERAHGL